MSRYFCIFLEILRNEYIYFVFFCLMTNDNASSFHHVAFSTSVPTYHESVEVTTTTHRFTICRGKKCHCVLVMKPSS